MSEIISTFLAVFAAIFPIVDPFGGALVFFGMTANASPQTRRRLAGKVAFYSFIALNAALYTGAYVLNFFGIDLPVLRVAGGLVVAAAGWKMLHDAAMGVDPKDEAGALKPAESDYDRLAFYPLTMPLTTGPGAIAVLIALGTGRPAQNGILHDYHFMLAALAATACLCVTVYVCFAGSTWIRRIIGAAGTEVIVRLTAFILLCIGVQILWTGARELALSLGAHG